MSKWPKGDHTKPYRIQDKESELRDIFAALAMQALINQPTASHQWVAHQAYKYADYMLDERNQFGDNKNS